MTKIYLMVSLSNILASSKYKRFLELVLGPHNLNNLDHTSWGLLAMQVFNLRDREEGLYPAHSAGDFSV